MAFCRNWASSFVRCFSHLRNAALVRSTRCMPSVPPVGDGDGRTLFVKPLSNVVPFRCSVQPKVHCANLLRRETLVQYSDNMLPCQISAAPPKPLGTSVCKGQHPVLIQFGLSATLRLLSGVLATRFAPKRVDIMSVLGWRLGVFRGSTGSRRGLTREVQGAGQVRTMTSSAYHRSDPRCESIVGSAWNKPPSVARRAGLIVADVFGLLYLFGRLMH